MLSACGGIRTGINKPVFIQPTFPLKWLGHLGKGWIVRVTRGILLYWVKLPMLEQVVPNYSLSSVAVSPTAKHWPDTYTYLS